MSDNPFGEPEDNDRTVLRVPAGGKQRPAASTPRPDVSPPSPMSAPDDATVMSSLQPSVQPLAPAAAAKNGAQALPKLGRSPLAAAAAPLLDLLARIGTGAASSSAGHADALHGSAVQALQTFQAESKAAGVSDEQIKAAHYALCAALDDTVMSTNWGQASGWATRSLSSTFHQDVRSGERFFDLLGGMQKEPARYASALEICYVCLSLGFRGRYRLDNRGSAEIERIREGLYQLLGRLNGPVERELSPHWQGMQAPHQGLARRVPLWVFGAVTLALLALAYVFVSMSINTRGDAAQKDLAGLLPVQPPTIQRAVAPVAPAPAPVTTPTAVDRVRQFLAPEIKANLLVVEGDAQRLLVRIKGSGMFNAGSADLQPEFVTLLARVGEAVRSEPGRVTVLGHSDNQPIRTVRFPSNFQLSAARAESALRVLVGAAGDASRFSAVGRADTEPLAGNDTPQGRETNRRVEVVVALGAKGAP